MNSQSTPLLSVVVPCYNEEGGMQACHEKLTAVLTSLMEAYEIVYIDDGSKDRTAEILLSLQATDSHVVVLRLSRNFGHQPAVSAGLTEVRGAATVIIDADLQDPPELIPSMLQMWRSGYQVVYGIRESREGETGFKLWTAKLFYRIINSLADVQIPLDTGDFRLIDRRVVDALNNMPERHRLLRGMSSWVGFSQIGLKYHRARRTVGETKYPLSKMLSLALDGIVSFSTVPLRLVTVLGFCSAAIAFLHGGRADAVSWHPGRVHRAHLHRVQAAAAVSAARGRPRQLLERSFLKSPVTESRAGPLEARSTL